MTAGVLPGDPLPQLADAEPFSVDVDDDRLGGFAWWQPVPAPTVVLIHGWGQHAGSFADIARELYADGWSVVSVAARGWPGSTGDADDYGLSSDRDIPAIAAAVREHDVTELWFFGYSAGGLQAARGVADAGAVDGLITLNAPMNMRSLHRDTPSRRMREYYEGLTEDHWNRASPATVADRITVPMLLIAGSDDSMVPASQAAEMAQLVRHGTHAEIVGMRHLPTPEQWRAIMINMLAWIDRVRSAR